MGKIHHSEWGLPVKNKLKNLIKTINAYSDVKDTHVYVKIVLIILMKNNYLIKQFNYQV